MLRERECVCVCVCFFFFFLVLHMAPQMIMKKRSGSGKTRVGYDKISNGTPEWIGWG